MSRDVPVFSMPSFVVCVACLLALSLLGATACSAVPAAVAVPTAASGPAPTAPPVATSAPSSTSTPAPAPQKAAAQAKRTVLAYYVPYDPTSWASFQARVSGLDYVAGQWVTVDACGNLGSRDNRTLISYAGDRGVKILPSLLTGSQWLNHRLLTDPTVTDRYLSAIVNYTVEMGYPGFDLDMENISSGDRDAFSAFVAQLAGALHARGKTLTMAIPAKTSDVRTGWAGPYDYAALGKSADLILLMTYDFSYSGGPPGSIAPQDWVDKVAAYAVSQMPAEKVLLGLAFYGYDWNKTQGGRARALIYPQAAALAKQYGTQIATDPTSLSATFSYSAKAGDPYPLPAALPPTQLDISVRTPPQCTVKEATTPTATPKPAPPPAAIQEHVVWLEDGKSVLSKLEIAARHGAGVGAWRLGQEDPTVWPHLANFRAGK